jgi:hypothetical protein
LPREFGEQTLDVGLAARTTAKAIFQILRNSTNSPSYAFTFSPDDAWFVYPENDSSGGTRIVTYSLKDGKSALLGVLPKGYLSLAFSDDSANVVATHDMTSSLTKPIYVGTAGVADSFRLVYDAPGSNDIASAGGYVAISDGNWATTPDGNWTVSVFPVSGGTGVTIPGSGPRFEPGVPQPHLMVLQSSGIAIAATDGTGVTAHETPASEYFSFTTWLGSAAVYGTTPDSGDPVTISSLTNAGAVTTLLANQAGDYAWSPIDAPTRIFYSRKEANDGGPVGIFYADLPR